MLGRIAEVRLPCDNSLIPDKTGTVAPGASVDDVTSY